jgi:hypothetical protein
LALMRVVKAPLEWLDGSPRYVLEIGWAWEGEGEGTAAHEARDSVTDFQVADVAADFLNYTSIVAACDGAGGGCAGDVFPVLGWLVWYVKLLECDITYCWVESNGLGLDEDPILSWELGEWYIGLED